MLCGDPGRGGQGDLSAGSQMATRRQARRFARMGITCPFKVREKKGLIGQRRQDNGPSPRQLAGGGDASCGRSRFCPVKEPRGSNAPNASVKPPGARDPGGRTREGTDFLPPPAKAKNLGVGEGSGPFVFPYACAHGAKRTPGRCFGHV